MPLPKHQPLAGSLLQENPIREGLHLNSVNSSVLSKNFMFYI